MPNVVAKLGCRSYAAGGLFRHETRSPTKSKMQTIAASTPMINFCCSTLTSVKVRRAYIPNHTAKATVAKLIVFLCYEALTLLNVPAMAAVTHSGSWYFLPLSLQYALRSANKATDEISPAHHAPKRVAMPGPIMS